jgi:uncharacterized membrane protein
MFKKKKEKTALQKLKVQLFAIQSCLVFYNFYIFYYCVLMVSDIYKWKWQWIMLLRVGLIIWFVIGAKSQWRTRKKILLKIRIQKAFINHELEDAAKKQLQTK